MARGAQAKAELTEKILEMFQGSFLDDKTIRVPWTENGEQLELKITLTCAKDVIGSAGGGSAAASISAPKEASAFDNPEPVKVKITESEAENIAKLLSALNL